MQLHGSTGIGKQLFQLRCDKCRYCNYPGLEACSGAAKLAADDHKEPDTVISVIRPAQFHGPLCPASAKSIYLNKYLTNSNHLFKPSCKSQFVHSLTSRCRCPGSLGHVLVSMPHICFVSFLKLSLDVSFCCASRPDCFVFKLQKSLHLGPTHRAKTFVTDKEI